MKYGVIDVGSNSTRLLISIDNVTEYKLIRTTRLAHGLNLNGNLSEISIQNTLLAISDFVKKAKDERVDKLYCFATSAVRTAKNGGDFVKTVYDKTGVTVDVVSERTEAEIGYLGALYNKDGGIIDIGGGSAEIQVVKNGERIYQKSLPVGAVRLTDICGQDKWKLCDYIDKIITEYGRVPLVNFLGIGGTATTVGAMIQELDVYDPIKNDGFVIKRRDLSVLCDKLFALSVDERKSLKGLQPERADIISQGAYFLLKLMDYIGISEITVSEKDNLEGYLNKVIYE